MTSGAIIVTTIVQKIKIITTVSKTTTNFGVIIIISKIITLGTTHKTLEIDAKIVIQIIVEIEVMVVITTINVMIITEMDETSEKILKEAISAKEKIRRERKRRMELTRLPISSALSDPIASKEIEEKEEGKQFLNESKKNGS